MPTAYIALGANLGDAQATLRAVFDELDGLPQTQLVATSSLYCSPPFGENADGPDYINAVAQIITSLSPHELLDQLQHLEQQYGRERHYQNAPRTLDLDILLYDDVVLNDERLILPHPRMTERAFVLLPLSEINANLKWKTQHDSLVLKDVLNQMPKQTCKPITKPTFEFCALHYLNQYLEYDKKFSENLLSTELDKELRCDTLKKATTFYKVARNLHSEEKTVFRYEPLLKILDDLSPNDFDINDIEENVNRIKDIESKISGEYNGSSVLSLTTKLLWLKFKSPILIYDSQARIALGTANGDLKSFYEKWHEQFKIHESDIVNACLLLPKLNRFAKIVKTPEEIENISKKKWFHERVFDIYLWSQGRS